MEKKILDQDFLGDMVGLLRPGLSYKIIEANEFVKIELLKNIKCRWLGNVNLKKRKHRNEKHIRFT
ncbi:hypothetical protein ACFQ3S_00320 [Mucilaginibacter terrae]|uniref:hypothetical protein n=1 Tax=Mucilaginibacter terrae TaxID=1955052 RepID=UPI0036351B6F